MRRLAVMAFGALALGGCAGTHIKSPAVCDGKHRRPANLYGTILPTLPVPMPASQGGGQSMVAPGPGPAPGPEALPAPPPAPAPAPSPGPGAALPPVNSPAPGAANAAPSAPRTFQRDVALSFYSC